jgi:hypothetical protein
LSDISFTIGILLEIQPIILLLNFDFEAEGKSQSLFGTASTQKSGRAALDGQPMTCPELAEGAAVPTWDSIELKPREVCSNAMAFYRITSLLPAVRRRKQGPSEFN